MTIRKEMLSHLVTMIAALGYFIGVGFIPQGHKVYLAVGLVLVIYSLLRSRDIWLPVRLFITAQVFLWAFIVCLAVRTTDAGFHMHNAGRSLPYCFLYAAIPGLCVLRLWSRKSAIILVLLLLPGSFLLSNAVAATTLKAGARHARPSATVVDGLKGILCLSAKIREHSMLPTPLSK